MIFDYSDGSLTARYARDKAMKETFDERSKTIKPCPFCGRQPALFDGYWHTGTYFQELIRCECGVETCEVRFVGDPDCIEIWNRRV